MRLSGVVVALGVAARISFGQSAPLPSPHDSAVAKHTQGRIVGVFDGATMAAIEGAEVIDIFTDATARTPRNGLVELSAFQSRHDSAAIRVRKIGYADTALIVMVGAADTIPLSLFLSKSAPTLPAMITEALSDTHHNSRGMGDFIDLMNDKSAHASVFTPADMRKADGRLLEYALFDRGIGAGHCRAPSMQLYIDGIRQTRLGIPKDTPTSAFEAAIFYEGNPPLAYNMTGGRGCGTLLLWTRRAVSP